MKSLSAYKNPSDYRAQRGPAARYLAAGPLAGRSVLVVGFLLREQVLEVELGLDGSEHEVGVVEA